MPTEDTEKKPDKKNRPGKYFLRTVAFFLAAALMFNGIQYVFRVDSSRGFNVLTGFYSEKKNTLDAVFIGASNTYEFWLAPLAWRDHGISVYPYSTSSMPPQATKYIIEEVSKTQPDTLFIINLNNFKTTTVSPNKIHWLTDYMPFSFTKLRLIGALCDAAEFTAEDRLEYYFPVIRFHSGWDELKSSALHRTYNGMKGSPAGNTFLTKSVDVSGEYVYTKKSADLSDRQDAVLSDLLDYLDQENVNALFVTVPQALGKTITVQRFNRMIEIIRGRGYPCLNLLKKETIGVDLTKDYYDYKHTNIHGSSKFTEYLSQYLIREYGFRDKRGEKEYAGWDETAERYYEKVKEYLDH